jgi:hypothetical protein
MSHVLRVWHQLEEDLRFSSAIASNQTDGNTYVAVVHLPSAVA